MATFLERYNDFGAITDLGPDTLIGVTKGADSASPPPLSGVGRLDAVLAYISANLQVDLSGLAPLNHSHPITQVTGLQAALDAKADSTHTHDVSEISGTVAFTQAEKDKLAGLEDERWLGVFTSLAALTTAHPTAAAGQYAYVDAGVGADVETYIWDATDNQFVQQTSTGTSETPASIKSKYESNADTNAFTNNEKTKLSETLTGAALDAQILSRVTAIVQAGENMTITPQGGTLVFNASLGAGDGIPASTINDNPSSAAELSRWLRMTQGGSSADDFAGGFASYSRSQEFVRQWDTAQFPIRSVATGNETQSLLPGKDNLLARPDSDHYMRMIAVDQYSGGCPVRNKVTQAISNFVVMSPVNSMVQPHHVSHYYDMTRELCGTTISQYMQAVSLNVGMATYLTFLNNHKADVAANRFPDENYAREVMQLFTIGRFVLDRFGVIQRDASGAAIETYTDADIKELARVFTGFVNPDMEQSAYDAKLDSTRLPTWWSSRGGFLSQADTMDASQPMYCYVDEHDWGEITFLGITIPAVTDPALQTVEAARNRVRFAIDELCKQFNVLPFWAFAMIQQLVREHPNPDHVEIVVRAGEVGRFRLPNGTEVGSGQWGDLIAMSAAVFFHEDAVAFDLADPTAGRVLSMWEQMVAFYRRLSNKRALYDPSLTPATLRDYILDGEYLHFTELQDVADARGPFAQPSVFGYGRRDYVDIGSPAGDAGITTPGLQGYNPSIMLDLFDFRAWRSGGGGSFQQSWSRGDEIAGLWGAHNLDLEADPNLFVDQQIAEEFLGGVLAPETIALLKADAVNRLTPASPGITDFRNTGVTAQGGPQAGAAGLIAIAMFSNEAGIQI